MNDYTPKLGDSVKLTSKRNPESVLFGNVTFEYPDGDIDVTPDGHKRAHVVFTREEDWSIEPWVKPVTFKPFAVVRLPDGRGVTQRGRGPESWSGAFSDTSIASMLARGAEILFEGVDQ